MDGGILKLVGTVLPAKRSQHLVVQGPYLHYPRRQERGPLGRDTVATLNKWFPVSYSCT